MKLAIKLIFDAAVRLSSLRSLALLGLLMTALSACGEPPPAAEPYFAAPIPTGWRYVSNTTVNAGSKQVVFTLKELEHALDSGSAVPLFVLSRRQSTEQPATLGVTVRRSAVDEQTSTTDHLNEMLNGAPQLTIVEPPAPALIASRSGARVTLRDPAGGQLHVYLLKADGRRYTIAASLPADQYVTAVAAEIEQFVAGLQIGRSLKQQP